MNTNRYHYSVRCFRGEQDVCRVTMRGLANAMSVYDAISVTLEYDKVQLVEHDGGKETVISVTTREEELYNQIMS